MLTALLRYALVLEQGRGAAPEEVFASDRVLQLLGRWRGWSCSASAVYADDERRSTTLDEALAALDGVEGWMTDDQGRRLYAAAAALPARRADRRDRQLPRPLDDRAGVGGADRRRGRGHRPARRQRRGPQEIDGYADEAASRPRGVRGQPRRAPASPTGCATSPRSPTPPTATVDDPIDVLYIDGAHRYGPARADIRDWGARVADGGTLLIHDSFSSVGVTLAIVRELVLGRRFRYVGRSRSLAEYRADLAGGERAAATPRASSPSSPWFVRNVGLKVLLTLGLGKLAAPPRPAGARVAVLTALSVGSSAAVATDAIDVC